MVNFEIADNPHYQGLEIQAFDDPVHGEGMLVFLSRAGDGRIDGSGRETNAQRHTAA